jgi:hypothetical protein
LCLVLLPSPPPPECKLRKTGRLLGDISPYCGASLLELSLMLGLTAFKALVAVLAVGYKALLAVKGAFTQAKPPLVEQDSRSSLDFTPTHTLAIEALLCDNPEGLVPIELLLESSEEQILPVISITTEELLFEGLPFITVEVLFVEGKVW